jgi:hypothetical protein
MKVSEAPVSDEIIGNIKDCAKDCINMLGARLAKAKPAGRKRDRGEKETEKKRQCIQLLPANYLMEK